MIEELGKIQVTLADSDEVIDFFVVEQTRINGFNYLLVADSEEDEAECLILKDLADDDALESLYEIVEDDIELDAILKVFEDLLEGIGIEK